MAKSEPRENTPPIRAGLQTTAGIAQWIDVSRNRRGLNERVLWSEKRLAVSRYIHQPTLGQTLPRVTVLIALKPCYNDDKLPPLWLLNCSSPLGIIDNRTQTLPFAAREVQVGAVYFIAGRRYLLITWQ